MQEIKFILNGENVTVKVNPNETLLKVLREKLGMTGTKEGCGEGECGACTVIFDSRPVNSCIIPAAKVNGKEVLTIEGLSKNGELHPIQEAFIEAGAIQCGFCTPGVVLSAKAILDKYDDPDEETIKDELSGHLCRCTGYLQFYDAIKLAVEKIKEMKK
ncbi:(2Fe-2S)-binding protein [Sedimentibacter sp. MB31-C6]|uniref:(2Fe-2S)-binding protein n=1 Tax=Sedimentibacter sp. MB31-C6 TaxID=3109366 RepID=UPI002DDD151E|nr:(2Fe-2S)-binding protein [Sedimentibacter sp. MB36-C1]WSI03394.1 (2Fe-2S)-binding protein [Sedimentibacter sp. MB36-C1]